MTSLTREVSGPGAVCGESVPAIRLNPGDTIRVSHHHHPDGGQCAIGTRLLDVEVTDVDPVTHPQYVIVAWHGCTRLLGSCPTVCGVSVFRRCESVLRIGHAQGANWLEGFHDWKADRPVAP